VLELGENAPQSVRRAAEVARVSMLTSDPQLQHVGDACRVGERPVGRADHRAVGLEARQILQVVRPIPFLHRTDSSPAADEVQLNYSERQEAFEKCWAHSPLRAATLPFTRCRYCRTPHHCMDTYRGGVPARRRSPISVLKLAFHDADTGNDTDTDILARILARK